MVPQNTLQKNVRIGLRFCDNSNKGYNPSFYDKGEGGLKSRFFALRNK